MLYCFTKKEKNSKGNKTDLPDPLLLKYMYHMADLQSIVVPFVKFHYVILQTVDMVCAKKYPVLLCNRGTEMQTEQPYIGSYIPPVGISCNIELI